MATFADNFNRANGALGGNWTNLAGTASISGGICVGALGASAINTSVSSLGRMSAEGHFYWSAANNRAGGPICKQDAVSSLGYICWLSGSGGTYYLNVGRINATSPAALAQVSLGTYVAPYNHLYIEWENGHLLARINGSTTVEADDVLYAGNQYAGLLVYGTTATCDDFFVTGGAAAQLTADPLVVGNYGQCTDVDLVGVNTAWVAGTPGSPLFTVDHGSISAQTVVDETHATVTYCPGDFLGTATFTDPSTGQTVSITVTSDPAIVPPESQCPFDEDFITTANATVVAASRGFPTLQSIIVPSAQGYDEVYLLEAIRDLWYSHFRPEFLNIQGGSSLLDTLWTLLNGRYPAPVGPFLEPTFDTVDAGLTQIWTIVNTMSQGNTLTLQTILDALGAGGVSLQDILDAIGTSWFDPAYTLHDDLDYLDNRSDHSLDQIQTRLGNMWGSDHWSLSQIVGAASDPQIESFASLHNIYARLQAMRGDSISTIANAEDWANLANTNAAAAHSAIDHMATVDQHTLQDVLDAIAGISIPEPAPGYQGAPVWPGVGNATVYQPYNLTDGLTVQGPLHGLLFAITGQPAGAGRYRFGPHNSWTKTGAVIFTSDRGDHERAQQFGLDAHVICPKEMRIASSATLRLNTGWTGTVRRFLID